MEESGEEVKIIKCITGDGIHKWGKWEMSYTGDLYNSKQLRIGTCYTQQRTCEFCGYTEWDYTEIKCS